MTHMQSQSGFAMLFTVLLVSLILSIALAISSITFKQTILSSLAKDSQVALYEADAGIECAMYQDVTLENYPRGAQPSEVPASFFCGENTMVLNERASFTDYFVFKETETEGTSKPCLSIIFDKSFDPILSKVQARGYNRCTTNPRQVERALELTY